MAHKWASELRSFWSLLFQSNSDILRNGLTDSIYMALRQTAMYTPKEAAPRFSIKERKPDGHLLPVRANLPDGSKKIFTAEVLGYVVLASDTFNSALNVPSQLSSQEISRIKDDVRLSRWLTRLGGYRPRGHKQWLVEVRGEP